MTEYKLRKNSATFLMQEAVNEINLSTSEFIDFINWAKIETLIHPPLDSLVKLLYRNNNFSVNLTKYYNTNECCEIEYVVLKNSDFNLLARGGKKSVFQYDAAILNTGEHISPEIIHYNIYKSFIAICKATIWGSTSTEYTIKKIETFYNHFKNIDNTKKWLSITPLSAKLASSLHPTPEWITKSTILSRLALHATSNTTLRTPQNSRNTDEDPTEDAAQPALTPTICAQEYFEFLTSDLLPFTTYNAEHMLTTHKDFLFLATAIYDLKNFIETTTRTDDEFQSSNRLDILNEASLLLCANIKSIKEPDSHWKKERDNSPISRYLISRIDIQDRPMLELYVRVLVDDSTLLSDETDWSKPRTDGYPDYFSLALKILNEIRDMRIVDLPDIPPGI